MNKKLKDFINAWSFLGGIAFLVGLIFGLKAGLITFAIIVILIHLVALLKDD